MSNDGGLWDLALTRWVDEVDRMWSLLGLPDDLRERLRRDLVVDLAQARSHGATVEELVSTPPNRFAGDVATAHDIEVPPTPSPPRSRVRSTSRTLSSAGLLGLFIGVLVSVFVVYPVGFAFGGTYLADHPDPWGFTLFLHAVAAGVTLGSAGLAIRIALGKSPQAGRQTLTSIAALAVSGVIALIATVSYASSTQFSTRPSVVAIEVAIVVLCCLCGLVAPDILTSRRGPVRPPTAEPPPDLA